MFFAYLHACTNRVIMSYTIFLVTGLIIQKYYNIVFVKIINTYFVNLAINSEKEFTNIIVYELYFVPRIQ